MLGQRISRADLVCSAQQDEGLVPCQSARFGNLGDDPGLPRRQQILLTRALERCRQILDAPVVPPDELLAADLRQAAADLGELLEQSNPRRNSRRHFSTILYRKITPLGF